VGSNSFASGPDIFVEVLTTRAAWSSQHGSYGRALPYEDRCPFANTDSIHERSVSAPDRLIEGNDRVLRRLAERGGDIRIHMKELSGERIEVFELADGLPG